MQARFRLFGALGAASVALLAVTAGAVPAQAQAEATYPFLVRVNYGPAGEVGSRGCTGTLIQQRWVVTASACFPQPGPAGASGSVLPDKPSSVTFSADAGAMSGKSVRILDLVWGNKYALLGLSTPVTGVTPLSTASVSRPESGAVLPAVGLGRTGTQWAPATAHRIGYTVSASTGSSGVLQLAPTAAGTVGLCQGDAGAPLLVEENGSPVALAGIVTGAGQRGCLGATSTSDAAAAQYVGFIDPPGDEAKFANDFEEPETQPFISTPYSSTSVVNIGGICCGLTGPELKPTTEKSAGYESRGPGSLLYSGVDKDDKKSFAYMKAFTLPNVEVGRYDELSYQIFPQGSPKGVAENSTCVAVDLIFVDGKTLRGSPSTDQNGVPIHPANQCKHLKLNEWNLVTVKLDKLLLGDWRVKAVVIGYDQPGGTGAYRGYIDNIVLQTSYCRLHPNLC